MKYSDGNKSGNIKPYSNVEVSFPSFKDGGKHVDAEYYPNQGDGNVYGPFKFCIFFSGSHAKWNG